MPGFEAARTPDPNALAFAFAGSRMMVRLAPETSVPALSDIDGCGQVLAGPFDLGSIAGRPAVAVALSSDATCAELDLVGLRELFAVLPEPLMALATRASQTLEWSIAHAFCGRCGAATEFSRTELARNCPSCEAAYYPRITPAVLILVRRGNEILLARGLRFGVRFYSVIAGFVEPGETLEQTVEREVREEVGIEVRDVTYVASQAWPFPSQLMVAFTANHASGELHVDESELSDAGWFRVDDLPAEIQIPPLFTLSGRLIRSALPNTDD